jgi:hypothetical protein
VDDNGNEVPADSWERPTINANGRFVAFTSDYFKLATTPEDCLWQVNTTCRNVFVRDRDADTEGPDGVFDEPGATKNIRISVNSNGAQASGPPPYPGFYDSYDPAIGADGRFVAFLSKATNLIGTDTNGDTVCDIAPCDTNGVADVFLRDRDTDGDGVFDEAGTLATTRISESSAGGQAATFGASEVAISADGRFVAFVSRASNLVEGDTNGLRDVFVRDRVSGATQRVSVPDGNVASAQGNGASDSPDLSADGRFIVFKSFASNLVADDGNSLCNGNGGSGSQNCADVFVRDLHQNLTVRVDDCEWGRRGQWRKW